jgi:hypothetical protein
MKRLFEILLGIIVFNFSCRSQQENTNSNNNLLNPVHTETNKNFENVMNIHGAIIDVVNGYCGVYCQGGMIEVKLNSINEIESKDTIYLITECWNMNVTDNFRAKIRETKPSDFIDNCLFEHYNKVKRYSKDKPLYRILK